MINEKKKRSRRNSQKQANEMDADMKNRLQNHVLALYPIESNRPIKSVHETGYLRFNLM